nr:hypothetical protein [Plantactinospora sp. BB1]
MPAPGIDSQDAPRITDPQSADSLLNGPADHSFRGLVLGLSDSAAMSSFHPAGSPPVASPSARTLLTAARCPPGNRPTASFGVGQVLAVLGAERPPGDQQCLSVRAAHRVRMYHTQVHPSYPIGVDGRAWLGRGHR